MAEENEKSSLKFDKEAMSDDKESFIIINLQESLSQEQNKLINLTKLDNKHDTFGKTPLDYAAEKQKWDIVKYLIYINNIQCRLTTIYNNL